MKIPITVGIVGHKDAIITNSHKDLINKIFDDINDLYPNSPVVFFSQLASGSDIEIAKLFLKIKEEKKRDYKLIIPYPFEENQYIKQFINPEEFSEYYNIVSKSYRRFELTNNKSFENPDSYRNAGKFVADSSIILLALYDGIVNNKKGGTADIVRYKIEGSFIDDISDNIFDTHGALAILPCNRKSLSPKDINLDSNVFTTLLKNQSIKKALDKIESLNSINADPNEINITSSEDIYFETSNKMKNNHDTLFNYYKIVDHIANKEQTSYNRILKLFFGLGLFVLAVFETYKHLGLNQYLFFLTIGLILMAYAMFKIVHKWNNHILYIEDRVLAEAIRIQYFWNTRLFDKSVVDYFLRIHKSQYIWIKYILLALYGYTYMEIKNDIKPISYLKHNWIDNQKHYFENKLEILINRKRFFDKFSIFIFILSFIILIGIYYLHFKFPDNIYIHPLIVLDSTLFGLFALIKAYFEKKGYNQIYNQYSFMASIYNTAKVKIEEIENKDITKDEKEKRIDRILFLTGKDSLSEIGNWYFIYKEKEPEVEGIGA